MTRDKRQSAIATLVLLLIAILPGCGGGGGSTPPPPPPPPLSIVSTPLPAGVTGSTYSGRLQATGGTPPYHWSTELLGIDGLSLATDGTISGTPKLPGTYIPNFTVTDSAGRNVTEGVEIDIFAQLTFATPPGMEGQNIALPVWTYIDANGGKRPYTFSLAAGSSMPPGLAFSNEGGVGRIQGTPTNAGNYTFTVEATDSFSPPMKISQAFTMHILNGLVLPQTALPDAVQNLPYLEQIKPAGGTPPYHFVLGQYSTMPSGLTLDASTGKVSGTPTTPIDDYIQVNITDSAAPAAQMNALITLSVKPPLSIQSASLPDSARGLNYFGELRIDGGRAPYSAKVVTGSLPDGITITPSPYTGLLNVNGVPTKVGLFKFSVQVTDSYETPNVVKKDYQVRISDQMTMSGPYQAQILYNQTYTTTFPISGGFPPYRWTIDEVPPGFTFNTSTGTLSGGPTGGYQYTSSFITAQDSSNPPLRSNYIVFQLTVFDKLQIMTRALPPIAAKSAAWFGIQNGGGFGPYTLSVTSGSLPSGMTLNSVSGFLTGTPSTSGTYPVTLSLSDGNTGSLHQTASQDLTIIVRDRDQLQRNDALTTATPLSSVSLLASLSPYADASIDAPDVDVYTMSAKPGTVVYLYAVANNDFLQPPGPNSMYPVAEVVDASNRRYETCSQYGIDGPYTFACINGLDGNFYQSTWYAFRIPGSGTTPVTFYVRMSDARGNARPDFIYTFSVYGVN